MENRYSWSILFRGHVIFTSERELPLTGFYVMIDGKMISGSFESPHEAIETAKETILKTYPRTFTHEKNQNQSQ